MSLTMWTLTSGHSARWPLPMQWRGEARSREGDLPDRPAETVLDGLLAPLVGQSDELGDRRPAGAARAVLDLERHADAFRRRDTEDAFRPTFGDPPRPGTHQLGVDRIMLSADKL